MQDQWLLVHRSLPTDLPVPYFQPIERGYMSEGSQESMYATPYVDQSEHTGNIGGTDYHPDITEADKVSTYTGLDDYDTLFAARHGWGALDPVPRVSEQMIMMISLGITPHVSGTELMVNSLERVMPTCDTAPSSQKDQVSLPRETLQPHIVSPSF